MTTTSSFRERGNLYFLTFDEIASVVSLPRNDIVTQPLKGEGAFFYSLKQVGYNCPCRAAYFTELTV